MKYALSFVLLLAACSEDVNVHVDCKVGTEGQVDCEVKQTKGKSEVEACWDFSATCANGATLKAEHTCQKVKDGGTVTATTPKDKVTITGPACDGAPTAKLENLTINGKKAN